MARTKVQSELIATNAISGTIIADGAITSTHLAANCVDSSELVTGSIDTIHIAANQVTATKIVTNGVLTRHISDDQVTAAKLANSINTDIATGVTANTTANAALPKAGGTLTGDIATPGSIIFDNNIQAIKIKDTAGTAGYVFYLDNADTLVVGNGTIVEKIRLDTSGNEGAITIDTSGHVGIGMTAAPVGSDTVLALYNSATPRIKLHNSTTGTASGDGGEINMSGSDFILENREAGNVRFFNNGSERMRIKSDGDVLVGGTTDRGRTFVVEGTGDLMVLYSTNAGAGGAQLDLIHDSSSPANGDNVGIINFSDDAKQYASVKGIAENTGASGAMHLGVRTDGSNYNATALIISSAGKVGIGNTSPYYNLDVKDSLGVYTSNAAGSYTIDSNTIILTKYAAGNADANQNENTDDIYFTKSDFGFPNSAYGVNVVGYFYASNRISGVSNGTSGHIWRVAGSLDDSQNVAMSFVNVVDQAQTFGGGTPLKILGNFNSTNERFEFGITWEYGAGGYGTVTFIGQATEAMG